MKTPPRLISHHQGPFVFFDKVSGQNTHAVDPGRPGLAETAETYLGFKVYTVSRLDQGTSGALIFAKDKATAHGLSELFESQQVKKTYLFLSHLKLKQDSALVESHIERVGKKMTSDLKKTMNARTEIRYLNSHGPYHLYEARPLTGKTHQIRLHAKDLGIPLLGDSEYGGAPFHRLCLHSQKIQFNWQGEIITYESTAPSWLEDSSLAFEPVGESLHRRKQLLGASSRDENCLRWIHTENKAFHLDQFGSHLWVYWYDTSSINAENQLQLEKLQKYFQKPMWVREMKNRGHDSNSSELLAFGSPQTRWICEENGVRFEIRSDQGLSPGLFLDQRENRKWVRENSKNKDVLNLFAYTGGFSVNAALGGANRVCTVDVSRQYLEWSKRNFEINQLDSSQHEFWEADSLFFLKSVQKKKRQFDLIICDPPSLGRSKEGVFRIEKDLKSLLQLSLSCLKPNGKILLSCNYEKWALTDLIDLVTNAGAKWELSPPVGLDFELPHEPPLMKSLIASAKVAKDSL